jgi:hypothetical protein
MIDPPDGGLIKNGEKQAGDLRESRPVHVETILDRR